MTSRPPPVLLSVNVGMPENVPWQGRTVYTGIWKHPVHGLAMVRRLNIDGDGQGDLNGHGGEQRAVLVYQIQSYRHWQRHFGRDDFGYGQFGENLTVDGLTDDEVCIGDRYWIGEAEFEVAQPRVTCYRVGLRLGEPELPALLVSHHRPGFYMRVITEGRIQAGDQIVKTRSGPGALSVAEADALLYLPGRDRAKLRVALQIPALSPGWQDSFRDLLAAAGDGAATTALAHSLRDGQGERTAVVLHGIVFEVAAALFNAIWWHVRHGRRLLASTIDSAGVRAVTRRFQLALAWIGTGTLVGALLPALGVAVIAAFVVYYWLPISGELGRTEPRTAQADAGRPRPGESGALPALTM